MNMPVRITHSVDFEYLKDGGRPASKMLPPVAEPTAVGAKYSIAYWRTSIIVRCNRKDKVVVIAKATIDLIGRASCGIRYC